MKIDRRILYVIALALVCFTVFYPLGLPVKISALTQRTFDGVQNLPDGSLVILSPMYDPGAQGELTPMFTAWLYQLAERHYKIIIGNTQWTLGPQLVHPVVTEILGQYGYKYGEDYLEWGSKPGGSVWLQAAVNDFVGSSMVDYNNQPLSQFAITQLIPKFSKEYVAALLILDCGTPGGIEWMTYVSVPTGIPLYVGEIQMSVPELMPYVDSGQYSGMIAGSRGAAEYELLIGHAGKAVKSQDTMSVIALMVALFIILGNIGYLARKK
jgi:hypothetical protein